MRRKLALVMAGVLLVGTAACSQTSTQLAKTSRDDSVEVWHRMSMASDLPSLESAGDGYQRRNPGVTLNLHAISSTTDTYLNALETSVEEGKAPCMAQVPSTSVAKLAHHGVLSPSTPSSTATSTTAARCRGLRTRGGHTGFRWTPPRWSSSTIPTPGPRPMCQLPRIGRSSAPRPRFWRLRVRRCQICRLRKPGGWQRCPTPQDHHGSSR